MEPKAKTLIERLGFKDPDRRASKHDEIQLWVYQNIAIVINTIWPQSKLELLHFVVELEHPITDRNYVLGFVDLYVQSHGIAIEVKTEIPNVGELLRQINFYRNYFGGPRWIVVSPDDRYKDVLKAQGIHFYKFQPNNNIQQLLLW